MRLTKLAVVVLLGMLFISVGCREETPEFLTYTDEADGFSISYPENWLVIHLSDEESTTGTFIYHDPVMFRDSITCAGYPSYSIVWKSVQYCPSEFKDTIYCHCIHRTLPGEKDYTSQEKFSIDGISVTKNWFTVIDSGVTVQAMEIFYGQEISNESGRYTYICRSILTASALECWDEYEDIFNMMLESVKPLN